MRRRVAAGMTVEVKGAIMATSSRVKSEQAKGERELASVLGETEAEALFDNRRKRDGDKAHITLANPSDAKKAVANLADRDGISKGEAERRIKALAAEGVPDTFRVRGVGKAESGGKVAYFLVVDWPEGRAWRESVGLDPDGQDFHITLGFGPEGDVHGVPKNRLMRASKLPMKQSFLRSKTIRLAHARPDLRRALLPLLKQAATGDALFDVEQELRGGHDMIEDGNYFDYEYVNLASEAVKDVIRRLQGAGFLDFAMDEDGDLTATRPGGIEAEVEFDSWEEYGRPWTEVSVGVFDPKAGESKMASSGLRSKVIRLAHARPDLRPVLLPLLKTAESFDEAVKGRTFTNPETGNKVQFGSLPSDEQKKIREKWTEQDGDEGDDKAKQEKSEPSPSNPDKPTASSLTTHQKLISNQKAFEKAPSGKNRFDKDIDMAKFGYPETGAGFHNKKLGPFEFAVEGLNALKKELNDKIRDYSGEDEDKIERVTDPIREEISKMENWMEAATAFHQSRLIDYIQETSDWDAYDEEMKEARKKDGDKFDEDAFWKNHVRKMYDEYLKEEGTSFTRRTKGGEKNLSFHPSADATVLSLSSSDFADLV